MTVLSSLNKQVFPGDGSTTSFNFTFIGVAATDLEVIYTNASGVDTTLNPNQYTLTLNAALAGALWGIGGTVVYSPAIALGTTLTVARILDLTQEVSISNQGAFYPQVVEQAIDLLEMQIQQVNETFSRAIVAPIVDADAPLPLPPAAQRANLGMGFDSAGNPIAIAVPSSGTISSAMQPVVNAASLALGRTAFGLGSIAVENIGAGLQDDGSGSVRVSGIINAVGVNTAVSGTNHMQVIKATGAINLTIARANTMWNGWTIAVYAVGGAVTMIPDSHDAFQNQSSGASLVIPQNTAAVITCDGASSGTFLVEWASQSGGAVVPQMNFQCRLAKSGSNLRLSRANGSAIFINGANRQIPASGPTLAPTSLSGSTLYYIYAYVDTGTITLEASVTIYTTDTTYGHLIKTGDPTRSLVGMAYTNSSPAWVDAAAQRFVRSYYNDPGATVMNSFAADRTTTSTSYAEISSTERIEFVCWSSEVIPLEANGAVTTLTTANLPIFTSLGIDGVTAEDTYSQAASSGDVVNAPVPFALAINKATLSEGYHYATLIGKVASNTGSWKGNATAGLRTTLRGLLKR